MNINQLVKVISFYCQGGHPADKLMLFTNHTKRWKRIENHLWWQSFCLRTVDKDNHMPFGILLRSTENGKHLRILPKQTVYSFQVWEIGESCWTTNKKKKKDRVIFCLALRLIKTSSVRAKLTTYFYLSFYENA